MNGWRNLSVVSFVLFLLKSVRVGFLSLKITKVTTDRIRVLSPQQSQAHTLYSWVHLFPKGSPSFQPPFQPLNYHRFLRTSLSTVLLELEFFTHTPCPLLEGKLLGNRENTSKLSSCAPHPGHSVRHTVGDQGPFAEWTRADFHLASVGVLSSMENVPLSWTTPQNHQDRVKYVLA